MISFPKTLCGLVAVSLGLAFVPKVAQADSFFNQGFSTSGSSFYNNVTDLKRWSTTVGAGIGVVPRYEGSDRSRFSVFPVVNFAYDQGFFYAGTKGIGMTPLRGEDYHVQVGFGYDGGRYESDDRKDLHGLGNVDYSILGMVSGDYTYRSITGAMNAQTALSGDYGSTLGFSVGTKYPIDSQLSFNGNLHTKWADTTHMRHFFGVKNNQAAASGKHYFDAESGFENVGATAGMNYAITNEIALSPSVTMDFLTGDAADSPITKSVFQPSAHLTATYKF